MQKTAGSPAQKRLHSQTPYRFMLYEVFLIANPEQLSYLKPL